MLLQVLMRALHLNKYGKTIESHLAIGKIDSTTPFLVAYQI